MIEIFRPTNGQTVMTVRRVWQAKLVTRILRGLDYAAAGEGWIA